MLRLILCFLFFATTAFAQPTTISPGVNITEQDGSPSAFPYQIKFANGDVTDNGDGTVSINDQNSGGGSSNGTIIVQQNGVNIATQFNTLNFLNGFTVTETPAQTAKLVLTPINHDQIKSPTTNGGIDFSTFNAVWTSSSGTQLWTSSLTAGDYFKIVDTGNYGTTTSVLKLAQTGNPTGGSLLFIQNSDVDTKTIDTFPRNFSVDQPGNLTMAGDLTVSGDDIYMTTNTAGNLLIANGTSYKPTAMSGDCTITSAGLTTCSATSANSVPYHKITSPTTNSGISFSSFNNTWTSTSGTQLWTSAVTGPDGFKIVNSGNYGPTASVLKLSETGNPTGGALLFIENSDTDSNTIDTFPKNFFVTQAGAVSMSGDATIKGDHIYMNTNTSGAVLVADGTKFNPVVMTGNCSVSSSGVMSCASSFPSLNQVTDPTLNVAFNFGANNSTWTSTTGGNLWTNANPNGASFKIVNTANYGSAGSVLKLVQTGNPTSGAVLWISNTDADSYSIMTQPLNFAVTQSGGIKSSSNTTGSVLVADGTTFNPVVMTGNCSITSAGVTSCSGGAASSIAWSNVTNPTTDEAITMNAFNNTWTATTGSNLWTSTTGTNTWTSTVTGTDMFSIVDRGAFGSSASVLRLAQTGAATGGSMLAITNTATGVNNIQAPNFTVTQSGGIKSSVNTSGAIFVANGTTFNPVVMSGNCSVDSTGNTSCSGGSATSIAFDKITSPSSNSGINLSTFNSTWTSTTGNNTWTSSTGVNLWTSSVLGGDGFTISNNGKFGNSASVLKLSQSDNTTGGSMLWINNTDTDTDMIRAQNFSLTQTGGIRSSINTSGAILVANGTTFNPVVMSGNCSVTSSGVMSCASGSSTPTAFDQITSPTTNGGINLAAFNSTWTSTTGTNTWTASTGKNLWTSASTAGDYFTISDNALMTNGSSILKISKSGSIGTGGSLLTFVNSDSSVNLISSQPNNFKVDQSGNMTMAGDLTVTGDDIYMATNTAGNLLIANGTSYKPTAMSGDCTMTSAGVIKCSGQDMHVAYDHITSPTTNSGINFSSFNNTWTATTGNNTWTASTGVNLWTNAVVTADGFTIADSAVRTRAAVLKVAAPVFTGGALLSMMTNVWTSTVQSIEAGPFIVDGLANVSAKTLTLSGTGTPTLSGCGSTPSIVGTDTAFTITGGTGSTGCTAAFNLPWVNTPICMVGQESMSLVNALTYTVSANAIVITQTGLGTAKLDVLCVGR